MMVPKHEPLDGSYIGSGPIPVRTFNLALHIVHRAQARELLERYHAEDNPINKGGRPLSVPRHVAVALMLMQVLDSPRACHVTKAADIVLHRLSDEQLEALGLKPPTRFEKKSWAAHKKWRDRIHASLDAVFRLIDPYWVPGRRHRWLKVDWDAHIAARDPEMVDRKMKRLYEFNNAIVRATVAELPENYRVRFKGHRAVDGTSYRTTARGTARNGTLRSIEPNAYWYGRDGDHKIDPLKKDKPKFHGYEATLFCWTKRFTSDPDEYPFIVDAFGHNPPGTAPVPVVVEAARTLFENDAVIGPLRGDNQYWAQQNIDEFHKPLWEMGFEAVTTYRLPDLGLQGEANRGAVRIDGDLYCPSILDAPSLISASLDYRNQTITHDELRKRITEREPYLLKDKQRARPGEKRIMMCPSVRGSLKCPLWPDRADQQPMALPIYPIESAGDVCTNQYSTSFEEPSKFEQTYRWGTDDWFEAIGQRSQVESYNKDLKDTAIASRNGVRVRGYGITAFVTALCIAAVNINRINTFLKAEHDASHPAARRRQRKRVPTPLGSRHLHAVPDLADLEVEDDGPDGMVLPDELLDDRSDE
jgi:hypothetical protein